MFKVLLVILVFCAVLLGYIRYVESKTVFFPSHEIEVTPAFIKLPFREINLKTSDNLQLHAWFLPRDGRYTMLFCHGNAGNISTRLEKLELLCSLGCSVFIFDYRGYGRSDGVPSERGMYLDTQAAYDYLVNELKVPPQQILIYGESLGGAAAVELARKSVNAGLILEGVFSRARDMARALYPFLPPILFTVKLDSLSKIKEVGAPLLFIHSPDDTLVPIALARKLYRAAPEPKYFSEIRGTHSTAFLDSRAQYLTALRMFIARLDARRGQG